MGYYWVTFAKYDESYEEEVFFTKHIFVKSDSSIATTKDDRKALRIAKKYAKESGFRLVNVEDEEGMTLFER